MKTSKNVIASLLTLLATMALSLNVGGCSKDSPVGPEQLVRERSSVSVKRTTQELQFLKSKTVRFRKIIEVRQLDRAAAGGRIEVGDDMTGISSIVFNPGDVSGDVTVGFRWDSRNFQAEFTPHGITFNSPVRIRLSYKDADLSGIDEDSLGIWFYDQQEGVWERTGRVVNKELKYVEGATTHFSRYAIAAE